MKKFNICFEGFSGRVFKEIFAENRVDARKKFKEHYPKNTIYFITDITNEKQTVGSENHE